MASTANKKESECDRCGAPVLGVQLAGDLPVYCANCQTIAATQEAIPNTALASADGSVLTVLCRLCHSQIMVDPALAGTTIKCPDCHSSVVVVAPEPASRKRQHWLERSDNTSSRVDPDAGFRLDNPANRPKIDYNVNPAFGLDAVTDDLLAAPVPVEDVAEIVDAEVAEPDSEDRETQPVASRRQRYDSLQRRVLSTERKQLRQQALKGKKTRKKTVSPEGSAESQSDESGTGQRQKSRRGFSKNENTPRRGTRQKDAMFEELFKSLTQTSILIGWVITGGLLGLAYFSGVTQGLLAVLAEAKGIVLGQAETTDWTLLTNSLVTLLALLCLSYFGGSIFRRLANFGQTDGASGFGWKDAFRFGFVWLIAGLPFLHWSILVVPLQFLLIPPLLIGAWLNGSWWKVVAQQPLVGADGVVLDWRRLYSLVAVFAAIGCVPTAMLHGGGWLAWPGAILLVGLTLGVAGVCGWHCRQAANRLEPNA